MKTLFVLVILMVFCSLACLGQNISVTFTGTGATTRIDSVTATNLTSNQSVTLPGNETLILTAHTGIPTAAKLTDIGIIYPNPFSGSTTFSVAIQKPQFVYLAVINLVGQIVAHTRAFVQAGENEFALTVNSAGIYLVSLKSEPGIATYKVICTDATVSESSIQHLGSGSGNQNNHSNQNNLANPGLKSSPTTYTLGYTSGEIILYKCFSGIYTTIVTDTLPSSRNYEVEFAPCTDADGKNYSIVKIGNQTWMAENLAYLPSVNPSDTSYTSPYYYVYGYESNSVWAAKATTNYSTFGVLYNWVAAKAACPSGWHLPTDDEWKILEMNQGMSESDANNHSSNRTSGMVGRKLKESGTTHWFTTQTSITNSSGFTALPGGFVDKWYGGFYGLGFLTSFWSSSAIDAVMVWHRELAHSDDDVRREYVGESSRGFSVRCLKGGARPTASFIRNPTIGTTSTNFLFDASGSTDAETTTADLEVRWDWNGDSIWDTRYDTLKTSSFQFTEPGNYTVILEVKDGDGLVDTEITTVIVCDSILTDSRDGQDYAYKTIGTQTWMIENLAYLPAVSPSSAGSLTDPYYYVYGYEGSTVASAKAAANYSIYGVLYNWEAAKTACPSGWHLPSDSEWKILETFLGMSQSDADRDGWRESGSIGKALKFSSGWTSSSWLYNGNGDNSSGLAAFPGGLLAARDKGFYGLGDFATFWSASENGSWYAWSRELYVSGIGVTRNTNYRTDGFSVRCLKGDAKPTASFTCSPAIGTTLTNFQFDASGSTDAETATADLEVRWDWNGDSIWDTAYDTLKTSSFRFVETGNYTVILEVKDGDGLVDTETQTVMVGDGILTDSRDGQDYAYKTIGTQTWMIKNLAYLPAVSPSSAGSLTDPYYYVYRYDGSAVASAKAAANYSIYGVLYNWEAAKTACPTGWHLPTDAEWTILTDFLGTSAGTKMKTTFDWLDNGNGDNSSGFTALPGGNRNGVGGFDYLGIFAGFWSSSEDGWSDRWSWSRGLHSRGEVSRDDGHRGSGFSVRCLRNN